MVKTQIQLPDRLYRELKRVGMDYEMSLAEIIRRSLERKLCSYPPRQRAAWEPPEPRHLGICCPVDTNEWRVLGNDPDYIPRHVGNSEAAR